MTVLIGIVAAVFGDPDGGNAVLERKDPPGRDRPGGSVAFGWRLLTSDARPAGCGCGCGNARSREWRTR